MEIAIFKRWGVYVAQLNTFDRLHSVDYIYLKLGQVNLLLDASFGNFFFVNRSHECIVNYVFILVLHRE